MILQPDLYWYRRKAYKDLGIYFGITVVGYTLLEVLNTKIMNTIQEPETFWYILLMIATAPFTLMSGIKALLATWTIFQTRSKADKFSATFASDVITFHMPNTLRSRTLLVDHILSIRTEGRGNSLLLYVTEKKSGVSRILFPKGSDMHILVFTRDKEKELMKYLQTHKKRKSAAIIQFATLKSRSGSI